MKIIFQCRKVCGWVIFSVFTKRWIRVDEHFYLLAWIWSKFCMRHCLRAKNANDTVVDIDIDSSIEDIRQWDTKLPIHSPCQKTQPCLSMDPHMFKSFKKEKETNRNTSPNKQKTMPSLTSSPRRAIFVTELQKSKEWNANYKILHQFCLYDLP